MTTPDSSGNQPALTAIIMRLNGSLTLEEVESIRSRLAIHPAREASERW